MSTRTMMILFVAAALLAAGCNPATPPDLAGGLAPGENVVAAVDAESLQSTLQEVQSIRVLTLRGTSYQRGLAHGRLLAADVLAMVDTLGGTGLLLDDTDDYDRVVIPMMEKFLFSADELAEMQGILAGVQAELGEKAVLEKIGRAITLADLKAANTAGDWYRQACSTFAAWGERAKDGHVWVGRNFDFLPADAFFRTQMIVVNKPAPGRRAWVTVSAPGMIGCITGFNSAGVFVSVHDVFLPKRTPGEGYTPRLLVLRRLMEACDARDLRAQALPILEGARHMFDNSIFLAAPVTDGTTPAVVFECNDDRENDRGVTVRTPADNEKKLAGELLTCTNHFRKRVEPQWNPMNYRYPLLRQVLMAKTGRGELVDFDIARKTMGAVRLPITVHTAIADLNARELWYAPGGYLNPPGNRDFVKLPLREWLEAK